MQKHVKSSLAVKSCSFILLFIFSFTCNLQASAATQRRRQAYKQRRDIIQLSGPTDESVWESGLLEKTVTAATLLEKSRQYHYDVTSRRFHGNVLAYVTPWNARGYDLAVQFRAKLTHVAPVWYNLRSAPSSATVPFELVGGHEFNASWVEALRTPAGPQGAAARLVPRVMLEMEAASMVAMLQRPGPALELLVREVETRGYDGLVFEAWVSWVAINGLANDQFRDAAFSFIRALAAQLHASPSGRKELFLAVPPPVPAHYRRPILLDMEHFRALAGDVDGWSVMTYDAADASRPGGTGPLHWVETNVGLMTKEEGGSVAAPASALLPGVPFYGYDYTLGAAPAQVAITHERYLALLARYQPEIEWDDDSVAEHMFRYTDAKGAEHLVYYPTCRSLQMRLEAAERASVGLSIWELGQGLERFMDML